MIKYLAKIISNRYKKSFKKDETPKELNSDNNKEWWYNGKKQEKIDNNKCNISSLASGSTTRTVTKIRKKWGDGWIEEEIEKTLDSNGNIIDVKGNIGITGRCGRAGSSGSIGAAGTSGFSELV